MLLINIVEQLALENQDLKETVRLLRDEINRLKGEHLIFSFYKALVQLGVSLTVLFSAKYLMETRRPTSKRTG